MRTIFTICLCLAFTWLSAQENKKQTQYNQHQISVGGSVYDLNARTIRNYIEGNMANVFAGYQFRVSPHIALNIRGRMGWLRYREGDFSNYHKAVVFGPTFFWNGRRSPSTIQFYSRLQLGIQDAQTPAGVVFINRSTPYNQTLTYQVDFVGMQLSLTSNWQLIAEIGFGTLGNAKVGIAYSWGAVNDLPTSDNYGF